MFTIRPHSWLFLTLLAAECLFHLSFLPTLAYSQTTMPTAGIAEREQGLELLNQRKYKDAGRVFRKAVEKNKTDPHAWYYLGFALLQQEKETKNATKAFETALKLRPDFGAARTGLSFALLLRNKLPDALRQAQVALSVDSKNAEPHYIIGVVRLRSGAADDALMEANEAIKLDPQLAAPYLLRSQAFVSIYSKKAFQSTRIVRVPSPKLTAEERAQRLKECTQSATTLVAAAEDLETYLRLNPIDSSAETWREQLETLRVFARCEGKTNIDEIAFSGSEVTTKARLVSKPEPAYTESARQAGVTGTVVFRCVFAADGSIRHLLVINALPNGLTEQALKAARRIKFTPATIDGRPVSMFIQLEYNFNLY